MPEQDVDDVAERLYALAPEDFTAAREAAAKQGTDMEVRAAVKALRRPSVSAWVVNLLARQLPHLLEQLLELGSALAAAQRDGEGDALRTLGQQRRDLVGAVTATAVELAGRSVTPQVRTEVEQTLEAALADPAAADAARSGRLVRPLTYVGFGGVDVGGAVARPPAATTTSSGRKTKKGPGAGTPEQQGPSAQDLEQQALDSAAALDDAVRDCQTAVRRRDEAGRTHAEATGAARAAADDLRRLERQLTEARARASEAQATEAAAAEDARNAEAVAESAEQAVARAQDAAEQARAAMDSARRP